MWLTGNKSVYGPAMGIVAETLWLALIVHAGLWGLLPLTLAATVIYARNLRKWKRET